jgi:proteasome lid subunit RPN8/RPN11
MQTSVRQARLRIRSDFGYIPSVPEQRATAGPWPDVTFYAPSRELTETEGDIPLSDLRAHARNPEYETRALDKPKRRRRKRALEDPALELYGGAEGLLVRTAIIRSQDYDERKVPVIRDAEDVAQLCHHLVYSPEEYMVTIPLDARHRPRAINEVARGVAGHVAFTAQQVLKVAFLTTSNTVVIVHNHPSGDPTPSPDDIRATEHLVAAAKCVDLEILDHIIVAHDGWISLRSLAPGNELRWVADIERIHSQPWK